MYRVGPADDIVGISKERLQTDRAFFERDPERLARFVSCNRGAHSTPPTLMRADQIDRASPGTKSSPDGTLRRGRTAAQIAVFARAASGEARTRRSLQ